ncbi:pyruvate carboxylase [Clostridium pasteurianum DSM 525 = ATCC 6013]|uniref:Pyruvate carboxylase n=1 Tax=Clostridium pasteurianum DSM 525 = ATCC 6013 TaxID=1262449 RepID=A0A0H3J8U2_CLOPA|nr:pyruvate carboxylase [Clostridium pasteurianum]AJA49642.1 pyruvate carboxylase [Clostridium pasteurianum DSM 525 = ATCC 6013]AJA53630.1 pyruvate carboxylase [Clostridium pasteurianum DSM 525 = ATCC 6013]AOZ76794.1 pyruvate carboxylase [Clostridium pasteurianum DSM 525 = ATCC 6013]AOZ80591.1 pyruvate carboxylase [Clostridium pasteurianum]ELP58842.1 pyruvate carboxylase [Clostridium pasteurianum DSM 525 = ATCC 6013]
MKEFKRVLVANRGEIAIRIFRACKELGIRTVAIYSNEDKYALFRTKADEAYLIGENKSPVEAYLNIEEIIELALKKGVDAIHPGYGFLSENAEFARKCAEAGIEFIGPTAEMMDRLGDKIKSKIAAKEVGVPTIPGYEDDIKTVEQAKRLAKECGYPIMLKAAAGGGGRGMRIVRNEEELPDAFMSAKSEAKKAFGIDIMFMEKYLEKPKHIEVQVLGDKYGNIVHLHERDCSIQRRHQKVIEFTPSLSLSQEKRNKICEDALKIARLVKYRSAGTLEFLVDANGNHYFIEMNPRVQVEHTITEMVTGIDIVQSQILIAEGYKLDSDEIGINSQDDIKTRGYSIQCRITTEDPSHSFAPDTGKIEVYRTSSGFGIRLDGGNGFAGAVISPYYDSLLVKNISWSRTFKDCVRKAIRAIKETNISGVKTNIGFLINVLNHPTFLKGECDTGFIDENPELINIEPHADDESRLLKFIGEKVVNETKGIKREYDVPVIPKVEIPSDLSGTKHILDTKGPEGLVAWVKEQNKLLLTDTTMRDANQSLMATRVRTRDMLKIAEATSVYGKDFFSLEMWGGATFDTAYRFLKESPWERLAQLRKKIPNVLFQMLIRGANAVGYKNYPDNVIREFIRESANSGIDVFRIFDSLNWLKGMEVSIDEVLKSGKVAEACICYTGDILNDKKTKYNLDYYIKLAKEIEKTGAHILGIKDMSALLKPHAAYKLIGALKQEIGMPIHLHTHDTTGNGVATVIMAAEAGVDIVDTAFNSMSGLTSQPALNSVTAALKNTRRDTGIDLKGIQEVSDYWAAVRPVYYKFESELKSGSAEIYEYEIPGGQYSNLKPQVESFGLGHKFNEIKGTYKIVNDMLGDIVKVTPSSKMVGDFAIFMVQNGLTPENIYEKAANMAFPDSVVAYFKGMMGQPMESFPEKLQKLVLKGEEPITCRPGELLPAEDFDKIDHYLQDKYDIAPNKKDALSYALYPDVFEDYLKYIKEFGDLSRIGSDVYFHGISEGETCEVEVSNGKVYMIKLQEIGKTDVEGNKRLVFEIDGNRREIKIKDKNSKTSVETLSTKMADESNQLEVGAPIPGTILKILVSEGEEVKENQPLMIVEAMKMETRVSAAVSGTVKSINVTEGQQVKAGELLIELK